MAKEVNIKNGNIFFSERAFKAITGYFILILYMAVEVCLCQITPVTCVPYSELFVCCSDGVTLILLAACVSHVFRKSEYSISPEKTFSFFFNNQWDSINVKLYSHTC